MTAETWHQPKAYDARGTHMMADSKRPSPLLVITPRIPTRLGAAFFCACGGRIVLDAYGDYKCIACGWDHWDLRPEAHQIPPPPPTRYRVADILPEGEDRVRCYTCAHVWILEVEPVQQGTCPSCGTKAWRSPNHKPIRLCNRPGCDKTSASKGLCEAHYWPAYRREKQAKMRERRRKMKEEANQ